MDNHNEIADIVTRVRSDPANPCFGCGSHNPAGLGLRFEPTEHGVAAEFVPKHFHQGWQGVVHGGILAAALDEAMAYSLFFTGVTGLTARMSIRYRKRIDAGDKLRVEAYIVRDTPRLADIEASILRDGDVVAEASGRFIKTGVINSETPGSL